MGWVGGWVGTSVSIWTDVSPPPDYTFLLQAMFSLEQVRVWGGSRVWEMPGQTVPK